MELCEEIQKDLHENTVTHSVLSENQISGSNWESVHLIQLKNRCLKRTIPGPNIPGLNRVWIH
jgi:hypothetical protein